MKKTPKLGSGVRFKALANKFAHKGIDDPKALAAYVGRKKLGSEKMSELAQKGKERAKRRAHAS